MSCAVRGCNSNWRMPNISFHSIPKLGPHEWLRAIRVHAKNWQWSKNQRVCSLHFEDHCFDRTGQTNRLKSRSVPTLNLPMGDSSSDTDTGFSVKVEYNEPITVALTSEVALALTSQQTPLEVQEPTSGPSVSSESLQTTTSEETIAKRRKLVASIHNYSCSPGKYKRKFLHTQEEVTKCRKRLSAQEATIRKLKAKVQSLEQMVQLLSQSKN